MLTWSAKSIISTVVSQTTTFAITDAKLYVLVVTFPTQDNAKLQQQIKSGFKRQLFVININQK